MATPVLLALYVRGTITDALVPVLYAVADLVLDNLGSCPGFPCGFADFVKIHRFSSPTPSRSRVEGAREPLPKRKKRPSKNGCPIGGAKSPCNRLPCAEGFWNMTSSPELSHCQDWRPFHAPGQRLQVKDAILRNAIAAGGGQMHCVHYVRFASISACVNRQSVSRPTWRINSAMRRLPMPESRARMGPARPSCTPAASNLRSIKLAV